MFTGDHLDLNPTCSFVVVFLVFESAFALFGTVAKLHLFFLTGAGFAKKKARCRGNVVG